MRRLLLLRHAKSDAAKPGQTDRNRALSARGRAAAPLIGAFLERHGFAPDLAAVSAAERTRETWALVAPHLSRAPKVIFEDRLYHAEPEAILEVIGEAPRSISTMLIVGHNPGLHELAIDLATSGDVDARANLSSGFGTANLAVFTFTVQDWSAIGAHGGRLERFIGPDALVTEPD